MKDNMRKILKEMKHWYENQMKFYRRVGLKNHSFSIISNNCTGGYIYQYFGIPYNSPTAGLLFETGDYLRLCQNPEYYFTRTPVFIEPDECKNVEIMEKTNRWGTYPCGVIDDVEIYFMHYSDQNDALDKWNRRCKRINYDNMVFLMTENEMTTEEDIRIFCSMSMKNKICLTYNKYDIEETIYSDQVNKLEGHPWRPEIIQSIVDWKHYLNVVC